MDLFSTAKSISIIDILDRFCGLKIRNIGSRYTCPLCKGSGFSIRDKKNTFRCFSCQESGSPIDFICKFSNLDKVESSKQICTVFGLTYDEPSVLDPDKEKYYEIMQFIADLSHTSYLSNYNANKSFYKDRCISKKLFDEYCLGYFPSNFTDRYTFRTYLQTAFPTVHLDDYHLFNTMDNFMLFNRYIIPIKDRNGHIIAFAGRSPDGVPKYLNSSNNKYFAKKYALFNLDVAIKFPTIYIVEGYFDALSLIEIGIKNVVASMGTALTPEHLNILKGKKIILALDNDVAGKENTARIIEENKSKFFSVLDYKNFPFKDFNEALMAGFDIKSILDSTITGAEFLVRFIKQSTNLSDLDSRSAAWRRFALYMGNEARQGYPINEVYTPIEYDYYWKHLNRLMKGGKR